MSIGDHAMTAQDHASQHLDVLPSLNEGDPKGFNKPRRVGYLDDKYHHL
jgi:hypothetical protein